MPAKTLVFSLVLGLISSSALLAQQPSEDSPSPKIQEFPVLFQRDIVAGKTAVGTKVTAKLVMATLVEKSVIPKNAVFSCEVVESVAKSAGIPSRLVIRTDLVQWKDNSVPLKAFLASWYYPTIAKSGGDLKYGPDQPAQATWNGSGEYPNPNTKIYRPFPDGNSDKKSAVPDTPNSVTANRRIPIRDVNLEVHRDGALALISAHSNIKLDRLTTYVLLTGSLATAK
jgi:hypothetical protein